MWRWFVITVPTSSGSSREATACRCRVMTLDCARVNQPRQKGFFCVGLCALGAEVFRGRAHFPSGVAQSPLSGKESVTTERYCCQYVSFPGLQVCLAVPGRALAAAGEPQVSFGGCQDYMLQASSRNFPFRHLFDDAWPTERRTASMSSSWPVTPTCCLTSESQSPQVALLELLLHQPPGRPITVRRIETHSWATNCSTRTEWTNGIQQRVWNIANPNGSHETCTRCFYFLAFFPIHRA